MMYLRRGGGYYFNVGCSELIISGKVKLLQFSDIDSFVAEGARLRDGALGAGRAPGAGDRLQEPAGNRAALSRRRRSPTRSARSGASTRAANCATCGGARPAGPLVHRRLAGAMPHLLALSGAADQGAGRRAAELGFGRSAMTFPRRRFLHLAAGAVALPAVTRLAHADTYPSRPVHIVIGFPPGQSADISARLLGQWLSERLGQTFVIDNKPGASSSVATEFAVRAPPDGYTLLWVVTSNYINATLYKKLPLQFHPRHRAGRQQHPHAAGDGGDARRFRSRPSPNSSPTPRRIPASSTWPRAASATRRTWPANCSR